MSHIGSTVSRSVVHALWCGHKNHHQKCHWRSTQMPLWKHCSRESRQRQSSLLILLSFLVTYGQFRMVVQNGKPQKEHHNKWHGVVNGPCHYVQAQHHVRCKLITADSMPVANVCVTSHYLPLRNTICHFGQPF